MPTFKVKFHAIIKLDYPTNEHTYSKVIPGKYRKRKPCLEEYKLELSCNSESEVMGLLEKSFTNIKGLKVHNQNKQ